MRGQLCERYRVFDFPGTDCRTGAWMLRGLRAAAIGETESREGLLLELFRGISVMLGGSPDTGAGSSRAAAPGETVIGDYNPRDTPEQDMIRAQRVARWLEKQGGELPDPDLYTELA